jgi:hypothetical protein
MRQRAHRWLECDQSILNMLTLLAEHRVPTWSLSDAAVDTAAALGLNLRQDLSPRVATFGRPLGAAGLVVRPDA